MVYKMWKHNRTDSDQAAIESQAVVVNYEACDRLAGLLAQQLIPADREDSSLLELSPKEVGNFYLLLVAISHQTSPLGQLALEGDAGGRHLRGWDYLSAKLEIAARDDSLILQPAFWAQITPEHIRTLFRDSTLGERLSDPTGRALLIRDLGTTMVHKSWEWADQLFECAEGRIATGFPNLLQLLATFRAYEDKL